MLFMKMLSWGRRRIPALLLVPILVSTAGCEPKTNSSNSSNSSGSSSSESSGSTAQSGSAGKRPADPNSPTDIAIRTKILRSNVQRLGMNLSGQSFYDSGQMLRDLTFRNPGFEGEIWQTILQCKAVNGDSCADEDEWSGWPADFAKGASFEFFYGAARGQTGIVNGSSLAASSIHKGVWINFGRLGTHPAVGDFYILRMRIPGNAPAGWRIIAQNGATVGTELRDISRNSPGKQALRLEALVPGQSAGVTSDFDTWEGHSFVQLKGAYTLTFRAKGLGGRNELTAQVTRQSKRFGNLTYLTHVTRLTNSWQDYKFTFDAKEDGTFGGGPMALTFNVQSGSALLDDASLTENAGPDNPTAFRNAVVKRLRQLQPGLLRYMDNGTSYGSSIDNLIAPPYARQRAGYSEGDKVQLDVPIGLHEFLVLCQAVKADPWFSMPAGMTQLEMRHLIEYLSGPATSPYGQKRAAFGQAAPWSSVFGTIHLELGNETWNAGSFPGEGIPDPKAYATRAGEIFSIAKTSPGYEAGKYDLILNGFISVPWWSEQELSIPTHADTIDVAPYTFNPFEDATSIEAVFGPMFAEPEAMDSRPSGMVAQQAKVAAKAGVKLAIYEVNLGTVSGKVSQAVLDSAVPSLGAGLSVADNMLLMLRDNGVSAEALFCLPEYSNGFNNSADPNAHQQTKLWGSVVDMGGETNRVRPTFLAEALANTAILTNMLQAVQSGGNPTWDQPQSANGKIKLQGAHQIQSFAFSNGAKTSVILFNLSRSRSLPVTFSGPVAPHGTVEVGLLTSKNIIDNNETSQTVETVHSKLENFNPAAPYALPPFSMTVLSWDTTGIRF